MINSSLLGSGVTSNSQYRADTQHVTRDWPRRLFLETSWRFQNRSDRILFTRSVRNEEITVPIPDSLISDEDVSFIAYISPARKALESHMRQTWASNVPICERIRLDDTDTGVGNADMAEAFAEAIKQQIVAFDPIIGKLVEDGEIAVVLQYDLDYLLQTPLPSDVMTPEEYEDLSAKEQQEWTEVRLGARCSYRRYKRFYWRDDRGRRPNDPHYRQIVDGTRHSFTLDPKETRKAWKSHQKQMSEGKVPVLVRLIPALDCAPILARGTGNRRWECRGLAIRNRFEESDLIAQGLWWTGASGLLMQLGFAEDRSNGRIHDVYEAHVFLTDEDGQPVPCIVYSVDGEQTWFVNGDGNHSAAVINQKEEYGIDFLPANYFWGTHTEDDDPDMYGYPVMYQLASTILNQEGTRTAFQAHLRKYAFSKLAMVPDPKMPTASYTNADGSLKDIDVDKEIVPLPGPVAPLVSPPPPTQVVAMDQMYSQDLQAHAPNDPLMGGSSDASGHSLTVQKAYFNSANSHVLEGARDCVEWIVQTAIKMIAALDERFGVRASVEPADEVPQAGATRPKKSVITFDPRWFGGNYRIKMVYPKVANLAEVQQLMDLYERGGATLEDVMEARGKASVMEERIKIMLDQFWKSPPGMQTLFLEVLKRRGAIEDANKLEAQMRRELQPDGMPTAAIPPEIAALAAQMGQGQGPPQGVMPPGQQGGIPGPGGGMGTAPNGPTSQMPGTSLPNIAASTLGGITNPGTGPLVRDSMATQSMAPQ